MDYLVWMGWFVALAAMGSASLALKQIAALKQDVGNLKEELSRRGVLEQNTSERKIIVPGNSSS